MENPAVNDSFTTNAQNFRALLENTTDIIIHANAQREITYISPAVKRIMGFEVTETIGKRLRELVYEEDLAKLLAEFERVLASPGITFTN
jgi:two-component system CheB/CheR fusion protein